MSAADNIIDGMKGYDVHPASSSDALPLVSIDCITYNHAPYLRQCLDGMVMQQTDFRFEILIHDDASTDGTQDIIREYEARYPDIIKPIYQTENQYSKGLSISRTFNFPRARGKYVALCEGDDYWTDPYKLQKQVDFLETHPEYTMCCSDAVVTSPDGEHDWCRYRKDTDIPVRDMIMGGGDFIQTASQIFRKELVIKDYPKSCIGDYPLQIFAALNGKVRWFAQKQVVYRFNSVGSWTSALRTRPLEQRLPMLVSEFGMLEQMNELSGGKYAVHFHRRIADHLIYIICLRPYRRRVDEILAQVGQYVQYFSPYQKFKLFLVRRRLFFILNIVKGFGKIIQGR